MPDRDVNGVIILIPVLDDWESVSRLIELIDQSIQEERSVQVLIVDDGSLESPEALAKLGALRRIAGVDVLVLERNLGNQRAIAIGLASIHNQLACQAVVVMDGDGEDDPRDIDRLLGEFRTFPRGGCRVRRTSASI